MSGRHVISLQQLDDTPRGRAARARLVDALPGARAGAPGEGGVFDVEVEAPSREAALRAVWDALAATGGDDHLVFVEHAEIPEHWRRREHGA